MSIQFDEDGNIIFVDGRIAMHEDCCDACAPVACDHNCTPGTLPDEFQLVMPEGAFNPFQGCGETCYQYAGTYILQWAGSIGGICRWTYCGDDPCNAGKKFLYALSYRQPGTLVLLLVYNLDSCASTDWTSWNEWSKAIGGGAAYDCTLIDDDVDYFLDTGAPNCSIFAATRPHVTYLS